MQTVVAQGSRPHHTSGRRRHVHIIVQNLPVPFDRRVWLECRSLVAAGYGVSVVCPRGPGDPAEQSIDGVTLYKYRPPRTGRSKFAFVSEYVHSFAATAWLTVRAWRRHRFDVLQACNPPDIFWALAFWFRLFGVQFVFDHHDLCPELYESKFGDRRSLLYRGTLVLERCTYRMADHVISTNDSYRSVALTRGRKRPGDVTVVRTGPDPSRMTPGPPDPYLRRGRPHLAVYLGVMGPQDGVDLAVMAAGHLVHTMGRHDISFTFIGAGESLDQLVSLRNSLGLQDYLDFTGRLPDGEVAGYLSTADVGLCPDPRNPLNDVSTMNKTMEYMAYGLPVVAFDLCETRVSAAEAAIYATPNLVDSFAKCVVTLIDDEPRRRTMGAFGRERVVTTLSWSHQAPNYVTVFDKLTRRLAQPPAEDPPAEDRPAGSHGTVHEPTSAGSVRRPAAQDLDGRLLAAPLRPRSRGLS
jgi:glycosyltransferase involved in cell wall biosynthesis